MIGVADALRDLSGQPHAVTIGNFDGVHRGHRYLIQKLCDDARHRGIRSLVMTFEPHPTLVLRPDMKIERLTTPAMKLSLLESSGVDDVAVVEFTREVAALTPDEFLAIVLESAHPQSVVIGEGFRFGRRRAGTTDVIEAFGRANGFDTTVISRLKDDNEMISSTNIRAALQAGDIAQATDMLGRRYRLIGSVEHGEARGRELGFPTANLLLPDDICIPGDGIYASYAHLPGGDGGPFQAMVYIGTRPTFDNGDRIVEANILDFSGDIYTQDLEIEFVSFVRGDEAFASPEALMQQMVHDEEVTRAILGRAQPELA
jgi:riboflavin kinase/FMN adenylyltransferase